jgi:RNA polymerase sigma factor (sigma-70 family)
VETSRGLDVTAPQAAFSDVLARARAGDADAVAALYARHSRRVMAIVRRRLSPMLRAKYDTMDLAQSVFLEVLRELPRLDDKGEAAFAHLLAIKAENKVRLKLRRHLGKSGVRAERRLASDADPPAADAHVGAALEGVEDSVKLRRLLDEFDADAREILRLHGDGRPFAEIASTLGLASADAARKKHARLVAALRGRWKRRAGADVAARAT